MIYDSPRSYQPDYSPSNGTMNLSDSILRRGARVGNRVYNIPAIIESELLTLSKMIDRPYRETIIFDSSQSSVELAWASANKGYSTVILASTLFQADFQYQTNLRLPVESDFTLYKSVQIFLNKQDEFLEPRKVDVIAYSLMIDNQEDILHAAQPYDVVIVDGPLDENIVVDIPPGTLSVLVGTTGNNSPIERQTNLLVQSSTEFNLKRTAIAQRLIQFS